MPKKNLNKNPSRTAPPRRGRALLAFLALLLLTLGLSAAAVEMDAAERQGASTAGAATSSAASAGTATDGGNPNAATGSVAAAGELEYATLERVVDGDTIIVLVNGATERVRLIGIDAAESVSPDTSLNTEEGTRASEHLKAELSAGQDLWLERDVSDRDKYGRLLRYVWLAWSGNPSSKSEARSKMLNAQLVAGGWAEPKTYKPDVSWAGLFAAIAAERAS